jgi:hypothetical protein
MQMLKRCSHLRGSGADPLAASCLGGQLQ